MVSSECGAARPVSPHRARPSPVVHPPIESPGVGVARLEGAEFRSVPHEAPAGVRYFAEVRVTHLVVEERREPRHVGRLAELARNFDEVFSGKTGGENPLLGALAPHHAIAVDVWAVGKVFPSERKPQLQQVGIARPDPAGATLRAPVAEWLGPSAEKEELEELHIVSKNDTVEINDAFSPYMCSAPIVHASYRGDARRGAMPCGRKRRGMTIE